MHTENPKPLPFASENKGNPKAMTPQNVIVVWHGGARNHKSIGNTAVFLISVYGASLERA